MSEILMSPNVLGPKCPVSSESSLEVGLLSPSVELKSGWIRTAEPKMGRSAHWPPLRHHVDPCVSVHGDHLLVRSLPSEGRGHAVPVWTMTAV